MLFRSNSYCRTLYNHLVFGRLVSKRNRGKKVYYYAKGFLHDKKFYRPKALHVFVTDLEGLDIEFLKDLGDITIIRLSIDDNTEMLTGREYWKRHAEEVGVTFIERK